MSSYQKSAFGEQITGQSGIRELMLDLGEARAMAGDDAIMMGGGNPAHIPEVQQLWRERLQQLIDPPAEIDSILADYDGPAGNPAFLRIIAAFFQREFGWQISEKNVAITNGGQTAFFFLNNLLAGRRKDGKQAHILLPLMPEYIGYADQGIQADLFVANRPKIELIGEHQFKYHIDFDTLEITDQTAAVCVSRPTNPSSNVLTNDEIAKLSQLTREAGIPLIIDNAYGAPFPGVIFTDVDPLWDEHIILTLSLSKLGLPGTRTGIVIAQSDIIEDLSSMTAIIGLANNNLGQAIVKPMIESGEILNISSQLIRPYYQQKSQHAQQLLNQYLPDELPWRSHKSEGAFFLWIWFENLPITSKELYRRLKERKVFIIPGEYFFFGLETENWPHNHECIRLSFTQPAEVLEKGMQILSEEIQRAYEKSC
ncbi:MAG: valine--pyruvate transaminase [Verrucomicrobiales bacterium]|nr:valine--pyruvate transaminase [Verrucomicrobiales bacterium]